MAISEKNKNHIKIWLTVGTGLFLSAIAAGLVFGGVIPSIPLVTFAAANAILTFGLALLVCVSIAAGVSALSSHLTRNRTPTTASTPVQSSNVVLSPTVPARDDIRFEAERSSISDLLLKVSDYYRYIKFEILSIPFSRAEIEYYKNEVDALASIDSSSSNTK